MNNTCGFCLMSVLGAFPEGALSHLENPEFTKELLRNAGYIESIFQMELWKFW